MHKPYPAPAPAPALSKTAEYLSALKTHAGITSDYAVAAFLGVSRQTLSHWQAGTHFPGVAACFLIADELGIQPQRVIADVERERAERSGDAEDQKLWQNFTTRIRNGQGLLGSLTPALAIAFLSAGVFASPDAGAMSRSAAAPSNAGGSVYYVNRLAGVLRRMRRHVASRIVRASPALRAAWL